MSGVIVHDWIEPRGGAENVLQAMIETLGPSQVLCSWNDDAARFSGTLVRESWIGATPLRRHKATALPFLTTQWLRPDLNDASWVLASSHAFAHHVGLGTAHGAVPKLGYIYTPARYLWFPESDPRGAGTARKVAGAPLRMLDRRRAQELTAVAAISDHIARRIGDAWKLDATVIYPPVDVDYFSVPQTLNAADAEFASTLPDRFILGASRFIPYKRLDIAIRLGEVTGEPVVLAGGGPQESELRAIARKSSARVTIVVNPSRPLLAHLYRKASALSFPVLEDFGIVPVEAMASGTPVIGLAQGGVAETVADGESGILVTSLGADDLRLAYRRAQELEPATIAARADLFSATKFADSLQGWVAANA